MKLFTNNGIAHFRYLEQLRERWGFVWRVRIGKPDNPNEVTKWCSELDGGEFAHSAGNEVYYFSDEQSSVLFRIRWFK